jgi:hypothetical protein
LTHLTNFNKDFNTKQSQFIPEFTLWNPADWQDESQRKIRIYQWGPQLDQNYSKSSAFCEWGSVGTVHRCIKFSLIFFWFKSRNPTLGYNDIPQEKNYGKIIPNNVDIVPQQELKLKKSNFNSTCYLVNVTIYGENVQIPSVGVISLLLIFVLIFHSL